jgi:glycosyltransferase involved in cell wall biosynthesis
MLRITIIIATYNAASTLSNALKSVRDLDFDDWECIVVDGASRDKTIDVVREYASIDTRIHYISEPDNGIYDAFNKGLKLAQGEWIYFLGADDKVTSKGLQSLLNQSQGFDILSGSTYIVNRLGDVYIQPSKGYNGCHQAKIIKRKLLNDLHGFDCRFNILADKELFTRMRNQHIPIKNIDTPIAYFSLGGISQSISSIWRRTKENYRIYQIDKSVNSTFLMTSYMFVRYLASFCKMCMVKFFRNI